MLYELSRREQPTATELAKELGLDAGYLSRILRGFETPRPDRQANLRQRRPAKPAVDDAARTPKVRAARGPLQRRRAGDARRAAGSTRSTAWSRPCARSKACLGKPSAPEAPYVLRPPRPGDMGWIVSRHGALYGEEYGWDERLEALCAEIVAAFVRNYDPKRERCWIAERDGENVGSVLLVKETEEVARLRLLLVEPKARGLGIGARLVEECVRFAREARYRKITLWTHSVLTAARHIYEGAGFKLVKAWEHDEFGKMLVGETWDLKL